MPHPSHFHGRKLLLYPICVCAFNFLSSELVQAFRSTSVLVPHTGRFRKIPSAFTEFIQNLLWRARSPRRRTGLAPVSVPFPAQSCLFRDKDSNRACHHSSFARSVHAIVIIHIIQYTEMLANPCCWSCESLSDISPDFVDHVVSIMLGVLSE